MTIIRKALKAAKGSATAESGKRNNNPRNRNRRSSMASAVPPADSEEEDTASQVPSSSLRGGIRGTDINVDVIVDVGEERGMAGGESKKTCRERSLIFPRASTGNRDRGDYHASHKNQAYHSPEREEEEDEDEGEEREGMDKALASAHGVHFHEATSVVRKVAKSFLVTRCRF